MGALPRELPRRPSPGRRRAPSPPPRPAQALPLRLPHKHLQPAAAGNTFTFAPLADTYIYQTNANTNYGSATTLQTDNSPVKHMLLKFSVSGMSGQTITSCKTASL